MRYRSLYIYCRHFDIFIYAKGGHYDSQATFYAAGLHLCHV